MAELPSGMIVSLPEEARALIGAQQEQYAQMRQFVAQMAGLVDVLTKRVEAMERENARRVTISHQQALSLQRRMRLRAETICEKYGLEPKRHAAAFRAACKKDVLALYGVKDAHDLPLRDYEAAQRAVDSFSCYALVRKRRAVENSLFEGSV